MAKLVDQELKR